MNPDQLAIEDDEDVQLQEEITLFPKQTSFVVSEAKYSGYGGGFGNGKTMSGCIKAYRHCEDQDNAFFLIGRRHATDLRDSTRKDFLELFGDEGHLREKDNCFILPNGAMVIFRHLDDLKSLTNMNLSGFWIDQAEEVGEDTFKFLVGRLRRKKHITRREGFLTFNMNGHDWIWRIFKKGIDSKGEPIPHWREDYTLVEATTLENAQNLPKDYVDALLSQDAEYIKRYVEGSWDVFQGQIFAEWSQAWHVIPPFEVPNTWPRYRTIDHGQNAPTACIWTATDYDNNVYVYQEYSQPDAPVSTHTTNIKLMSQVQAPSGLIPDNYEYTLIDPSTSAKNREKRMDNGTSIVYSVKDEYADAGINTTPAQNDRLAGINRVREYLKVDPNRYHPFRNDAEGNPAKGSPRLFVFDSCPVTIEEMAQYRWKPNRTMGGDEMQDPKPEVLKRDDHCVDCLRYFVMSRPVGGDVWQYMDPTLWQHPLELARFARQQGMTVDDLITMRYGGPRKLDTQQAVLSTLNLVLGTPNQNKCALIQPTRGVVVGNGATPTDAYMGQGDMLDWFAASNNSAAEYLYAEFAAWCQSIRDDGGTLDEDYAARCLDDLVQHGRLTAETVQGHDPVPPVVIGETE